ncbi:putative helicase mov-10-B.2 [Xiphias gladius]|uniref:putative helicase mov-10-B.2 n=1 Tax=Xiphias gladius TaxID=8245 RepID=UPI001A9906E5|nr:putative helicase mov-10-B.2 [Xiphias gladius]
MVNMKFSLWSQIGLQFFEFLKENNQASIEDRLQLKRIYTDFRGRNADTKCPNFGSVLYALKVSGKITRRGDTIRFNSEVRGLYEDQWHTPRGRQPQAVRNGVASPLPVQTFTSPDAAETGVRDRRNLARCLLDKLETDRAQLISDKHGICITSEHQFENGKLCLCVEDTYEYMVTLNVQNTGTKPVYFMYYTPLYWPEFLNLVDEHKVTKANPLLLQPGDGYEIKVYFCCRWVGFYSATLAFEFRPDLQPSSTAFHIVRFIEAQCITSLGLELAPTAPYKPRSLPEWIPKVNFKTMHGQRPDGLSKMCRQNAFKLKMYPIPPYMKKLIKALKKSTPLTDKRMVLLESPLSWGHYRDKLQLLLYLEELQKEVDIRRYNIPNNEQKHAVMSRDKVNKTLLVLEVPGLSEKRPSLLQGDELLVCPIGETGVKYRGYIHSVELESVKLSFSPELLDHFVDSMKFSVEFCLHRLTLRIQHRAAELATKHRLGKVLFPAAPSYSPQQTELPNLRLFDSQLEKNPEQYQAVQHIVAGSSKPAPYLVFGPPGTGKTVTLVEAIKQIEKTQASCHILACAPCNSAADLLCEMILVHVDRHKVYRMYANSCDPKGVPERLKECSNLEGQSYDHPLKKKLMEYRIMVTTLFTAGRLVVRGVPPGHFSHVFVDEAGHAAETQCLIPLAGLLHAETGQVVLAGDPKQLGPILQSPFALKYGMGVSLLERMMNDFSLYQKDEGVFNNRFVTKLLRNYRSHPAILEIPNELFYERELLYHADKKMRNSCCNWEHLPERDFPLIFHGVSGVDEREASSPSFFNKAEVEVLMDYVKKLLQTQPKKGQSTISAADIGIIAPYRKQVQKIRMALEKVGNDLKIKDIHELKVGSVEEFQGQEKRVIMVSTVRSSRNYDFDKQFNLGFVRNEKRFNVAVTRAKALLIVVGNPRVLNTDPIWNRFIQYCSDRRGCTGIFL